MMTKIELGKQYRTRDGREVRIYAVDGEGPYPVHGACEFKKGEGLRVASWRPDGTVLHDRDPHWMDLIEVKPRIKFDGWALLYRESTGRLILGYPHATKAEALKNGLFFSKPVSCIPITIDCEEGEGLT